MGCWGPCALALPCSVGRDAASCGHFGSSGGTPAVACWGKDSTGCSGVRLSLRSTWPSAGPAWTLLGPLGPHRWLPGALLPPGHLLGGLNGGLRCLGTDPRGRLWEAPHGLRAPSRGSWRMSHAGNGEPEAQSTTGCTGRPLRRVEGQEGREGPGRPGSSSPVQAAHVSSPGSCPGKGLGLRPRCPACW